jgi:hypothetical protein
MNAQLRGANFSDACLNYSDLTNANLAGALFENTKVAATVFGCLSIGDAQINSIVDDQKSRDEFLMDAINDRLRCIEENKKTENIPAKTEVIRLTKMPVRQEQDSALGVSCRAKE